MLTTGPLAAPSGRFRSVVALPGGSGRSCVSPSPFATPLRWVVLPPSRQRRSSLVRPMTRSRWLTRSGRVWSPVGGLSPGRPGVVPLARHPCLLPLTEVRGNKRESQGLPFVAAPFRPEPTPSRHLADPLAVRFTPVRWAGQPFGTPMPGEIRAGSGRMAADFTIAGAFGGSPGVDSGPRPPRSAQRGADRAGSGPGFVPDAPVSVPRPAVRPGRVPLDGSSARFGTPMAPGGTLRQLGEKVRRVSRRVSGCLPGGSGGLGRAVGGVRGWPKRPGRAGRWCQRAAGGVGAPPAVCGDLGLRWDSGRAGIPAPTYHGVYGKHRMGRRFQHLKQLGKHSGRVIAWSPRTNYLLSQWPFSKESSTSSR